MIKIVVGFVCGAWFCAFVAGFIAHAPAAAPPAHQVAAAAKPFDCESARQTILRLHGRLAERCPIIDLQTRP